MSRKVENWLKLFPEISSNKEFYSGLTSRELSIVGCSVLDIALCHLLEKRLLDDSKETESFLGLDDNGRAPAGSFGARIQLALLLGLIVRDDAIAFRAYKSIRNKFAHKVSVKLTDASVTPFVEVVHDYLRKTLQRVYAAETVKTFDECAGEFKSSENDAQFVLELCLVILQESLDKFLPKVRRIKLNEIVIEHS